MSPKKETKQKPVSTPVMIAAGVGLIALAVLYLQPSNPAPAPQSSQKQNVGQANTTMIPSSASNDTVSPNAAEDPSLPTSEILDGVRDPFLPSTLFAKSKPGTSDSSPIKPSLPVTPPIIQPVTPTIVDKTDKVEPVKRETQIAWKGTATVKNDQVIILKVQNKSYTLRLGDKVPGTDYLIAEISPESILLISPNEQKRLSKKKEEK